MSLDCMRQTLLALGCPPICSIDEITISLSFYSAFFFVSVLSLFFFSFLFFSFFLSFFLFFFFFLVSVLASLCLLSFRMVVRVTTTITLPIKAGDMGNLQQDSSILVKCFLDDSILGP